MSAAAAGRPACCDLGDALQKHLPDARELADRERLGGDGAADALGLRHGGAGGRLGGELQAGDVVGELGEIGEDDGRVGADIVLRLELGERGLRVAAHDALEEIDDAGAVGEAEHLLHGVDPDRAAAMGDGLVEDGEGVAHRALGGAGDLAERVAVGLDLLLGGDAGEMVDQHGGLDAAEIEALAARQDRDRHFPDLGRGEDEFHMRRGLLQRLQQAVEGLLGEHVDLVDDVDLVAGGDRRVAGRIDDVADVVDAGVGGGVHLDDVGVAALHDGAAVDALGGQIDGGRAGAVLVLVIEAAGEDAGGGGLADAADAGQHPGMRNPAGREGVPKRADHRLLADEIVKAVGPVFPGKNPVVAGDGVGHGPPTKRIVCAKRREAGRQPVPNLVGAASFRT